MLIDEKAALARLSSPLNLINRLKDTTSRKNAMSLFGVGREVKSLEPFLPNPFDKQTEPPAILPAPQGEEPNLDTILKNSDSQIKLGLAHDKALDLLHRSVDALASKLDDVKAERLPAVISAASKTVESIRKERLEAARNSKDREVHYHFYTPTQKPLESYEVIDVASSANT